MADEEVIKLIERAIRTDRDFARVAGHAGAKEILCASEVAAAIHRLAPQEAIFTTSQEECAMIVPYSERGFGPSMCDKWGEHGPAPRDKDGWVAAIKIIDLDYTPSTYSEAYYRCARHSDILQLWASSSGVIYFAAPVFEKPAKRN